MRPPRVVILVLFFVASLFLFCRSISTLRRPGPALASTSQAKSQIHSYFSWGVPFALFPPNAAISLTDDNSTFFPARPATFGPPLPARGLSGQLWIGSGFADDNLQDSEGEGELGCSDVPGWEDGKAAPALQATDKTSKLKASSPAGTAKSKNAKRDDLAAGPLADRTPEKEPDRSSKGRAFDDGTDDYLHQGLMQPKRSSYDASSTSSGSSHADIQSIQEAAEIAGKVVLLSRGGCGFLEKVKWAQRRGALALIVGDNVKGGPLIQMSAHGDVSNVTIPSIFTSRTTAHLLSSLMQPGSFIEDIVDEKGNAALKVQHYDKSHKGAKGKQTAETTTPAAPRATALPKSSKPAKAKKDVASSGVESSSRTANHVGWFSRLFRWGSASAAASDRRRPPSSGRFDWVLVDDWSDEKDKIIKSSLDKAAKNNGASSSQSGSNSPYEDNFQIGVQDWRDPDLVDSASDASHEDPAQLVDLRDAKSGSSKSSSSGLSGKGSSKSMGDSDGPKGGSITPGSGEYAAEGPQGGQGAASPAGKSSSSTGSHGGLISKLFGEDDGADFVANDVEPNPTNLPLQPPTDGSHERDGLWVTITPTSGASPFFDTLLILVISPLITLTVVYALLILRAKIRRRRWRAPKSVIDRLPVRTYHTVASSPGHSPRLPSPTSSSPTTPLLQSSSRPRPRSRTTTGVLEGGDLLRVDAALQASRSPSRSGPDAGQAPSEWKKYMGRQVECVVCLEEYVDGLSRVMSLPCGHEFHAECITPWLTTRRRTCPICKGDVVRSLARGSPSSPRYEPYHDDSDDDVAEPVGRSTSPGGADSDTEQGFFSTSQPRQGRRPNRADGWFNILSNSLGSASSSRRRSDSEAGRNA